MIKKYLIVFILFIACLKHNKAQQLTQYSLYMFNNYVLNPAVAGSTPCTDIKLGYRTQWVGFEGQPKTMYASFYKPIKFRRGGIQRGRHAIGAYAEQDQTGPSQRTVFYLSYAYHLPLNRKYWMGLGIFGGVMQYSLNTGGLFTTLPGDATLASAGNKLVAPDFSPGIWVYSSKHYVGLSVKSIVGNRLTGEGRLTRNIYFTTGYKIVKHGAWAYIPSVFVRYTPGSPAGLDLNLFADYANVFAIGLGYRTTDAALAMIKFNVRNFFFAYTYDFNLSKLRVGNSNSHELMIGFKICPADYNAKNSGHGNNPNTNKCAAYN